MSKLVTISKLEALLSRIRTRAAEPRSSRPAAVGPAPATPVSVAAAPPAPPPAAVAAPAPVAPPAPVAAPAFVAQPAPTFVAPAVRAAPEPSPEPPELMQVDEPTLPPPPLNAATSDGDFAVDVEVPSGSSEPPPVAAEAHESRERLSAAPPVLVEPAAADGGHGGTEREELANEVNEGGIAGDEDEPIEETPASSRRPVASPPEERLAELAFGAEEQPARHTPPPKSGRLPAPPAGDFDPDVTGVRPAPAKSADDDAMPPSSQRAEPSVLAAQAVRPNLASGTDVRVPDVIGEAQRFAPATFLALLDASLAL